MATMTIKKGQFKMNVDRDLLVEVSETADGVVFNFKEGIQLAFYDQMMQSGTKQIIKNTADSFPGKKLVFNLDNPRQPAMVDAM